MSTQYTHRYNSTFRVKDSKLKRGGKLNKRGRLRSVRKVEHGSEVWLKQIITRGFSEFIRERDPFCFCGKPSEHAGHFYHRSIPILEFDPRNVIGICAADNYAHESNPEPMRAAMLARFGEDVMEELKVLSWDHKKLTYSELETLAEVYKPRRR
jgi:hypothetical protein